MPSFWPNLAASRSVRIRRTTFAQDTSDPQTLRESMRIQQETLDQLQRKQPVNICCVVSVSFKVATNDFLDAAPFQIGARECPRVEQHLLNIIRKNRPVPPPEVEELVAPHPQAL